MGLSGEGAGSGLESGVDAGGVVARALGGAWPWQWWPWQWQWQWQSREAAGVKGFGRASARPGACRLSPQCK